MTYIIDLERLWQDRSTTSANLQQAALTALDPRQYLVSVILVAYAEESNLLRTLQSVLAQPFVREIIIVNCENSPTLEVVLSKFIELHPKCYLVTGQSTMGVAAAYNLGAQYASCQYLLFLDGACLLPKNALLKLLSTGVHKSGIWVVGIEDESHSANQLSWGAAMKAWLGLKANPCPPVPEVSLPGGGCYTASVGPDCLFISTKTFLALKGMDKKYFHSAFHLDFCLRLHLAGGSVYSAKDLSVVLQPRSQPFRSLRQILRQEWQTFCGWRRFYRKHISKYTNFFLMGMLYLVLTVRCLGVFCARCLSYLGLPSSRLNQHT